MSNILTSFLKTLHVKYTSNYAEKLYEEHPHKNNLYGPLDIPEDAAFKPRTILENKYLVDWEQPDNDENPILVMVEP